MWMRGEGASNCRKGCGAGGVDREQGVYFECMLHTHAHTHTHTHNHNHKHTHARTHAHEHHRHAIPSTNTYRSLYTQYIHRRKCAAVCCGVRCSVLHCLEVCCSVHKPYMHRQNYGVAAISRLLKIIGLFCRIQSLL